MTMYRRYYDEIISYLENGTYWAGATDSEKAIIEKKATKYKVINGILYHKGKGRGVEDLRFVPISVADQLNAIRICHTKDDDEHYGINKTASLLSSKFYWRMMFTDVIKFIKKCPICKEINNIQWNFLQEEEKEKANTWKLVEIDIMENFHSTRKNVFHVIRLVDVFSNLTSYVPLTDLNEKSIVKGILKEFSIIGFPLSFRFVNLKSPSSILKVLQSELVNFSIVHSNSDGCIDYSVHVTMEESYTNGQLKPTTEEYLNQYQEVLDKHKASLYVFFGSFSITVEGINTFYCKKLEEFCKEYPYTWTNKLHYLLFSVQNTIPPEMKMSPHSLVFGRSGGLFHPESNMDKFYDTELLSDSFFNLECVKEKPKPKARVINDLSDEPPSDSFLAVESNASPVGGPKLKGKKRKLTPKDEETDDEWPKLTEDEDKMLEEMFPEDERVPKKIVMKKNKNESRSLKSSMSKKQISPNEQHKNRKRSVSFLSEEQPVPVENNTNQIQNISPSINNIPPYYQSPSNIQSTPLRDPYASPFPTPEPTKEVTPGRYSFRQNLKAKGPSSFVHRFIAISTSKRGTSRMELESPETPTPMKRKVKNKTPPVYPSTSSPLLKDALNEFSGKKQVPMGITPLQTASEDPLPSKLWNTSETKQDSSVISLFDTTINKTSSILNSDLIVPNTDQAALNNVLKGDLFSTTISTPMSETSSQSKENSVFTEEPADALSDHESDEILDKERDTETDSCLNIALAHDDQNIEQIKFNILADDLQLSDEDSLIEKVSMDIDMTTDTNVPILQEDKQDEPPTFSHTVEQLKSLTPSHQKPVLDESSGTVEIPTTIPIIESSKEDSVPMEIDSKDVQCNESENPLHSKECLKENIQVLETCNNISAEEVGEVFVSQVCETFETFPIEMQHPDIEDAMCVVGDCEVVEEEEDQIVLENKPDYQGYVEPILPENATLESQTVAPIKAIKIEETISSEAKGTSEMMELNQVTQPKLNQKDKEIDPQSIQNNQEINSLKVTLTPKFLDEKSEDLKVNLTEQNIKDKECNFLNLPNESPAVFTASNFSEEIKENNIDQNGSAKAIVFGEGLEQFEIIQPSETNPVEIAETQDFSELRDSTISPNIHIFETSNIDRTSTNYAKDFGLMKCNIKINSLPLDLVRQAMSQSIYLRTIVYNNRKSYYYGSNKIFDMKYEPRTREVKIVVTPTVVITAKDLLPDNASDISTGNDSKKTPKKKAPVMEEKTFKCPVCPKTVLANEDMLNLHLKFHCASEVRNIICPICQKPGSSWQALLRHYSNHDEGREELKNLNLEVPNNAVCPICRKICSSKEALTQHMQLKHPANEIGEKYKCDKCEEQFRDSKALKRHSEKHANQSFVCVDCGYSTKIHYNYLMHRDHECQLAKRGIEIKSEPIEIDYSALQEKIVPTKFNCEKCKHVALSMEKLEEHVKNKHPPSKNSKILKCEFCSLKFKNSSSLNAHMPSHEDLMLFTCKLCDYKNKHKNVVSRHVKKNHEGVSLKQVIKGPKRQWQRRKQQEMVSDEEIDTDGLEDKKDSVEDSDEKSNVVSEDEDDGIPTATIVVSQDEFGGIVLCDEENDAELAIDSSIAEPPTATLVLEDGGLALDGDMALQLLQGTNTTVVDGTETNVLYVSMGSESYEVLDNSAFTIIDNDR